MDDGYFKGRGAQVKPANPFLNQSYVTEHIEGLDEPLIAVPQTQIFYETPKKIVNKVDSPDVPAMLSINPYQGCEHGCIYCYARPTHEYWGFNAGLDFESKIVVKKNAAQLLEHQLLKKTWKPEPIMVSGNTDCYQPLESKLGITRSLLEVCAKYRHPIGIITKNTLVLRDKDILQDMSKDGLVHVYFSINTLDEKLRGKMEPRTASAKKKLKAIETLSAYDIPVGIMNAPVIPGLNHHEIPEIIRTAADSGARNAGYTVVRLNGNISIVFKDWLEKNFPDRAQKVWHQICQMHGGNVNDSRWGKRMGGEGPIAKAIHSLFSVAKKKYLRGKEMPPFDLSKFRRGGNYNLFG